MSFFADFTRAIRVVHQLLNLFSKSAGISRGDEVPAHTIPDQFSIAVDISGNYRERHGHRLHDGVWHALEIRSVDKNIHRRQPASDILARTEPDKAFAERQFAGKLDEPWTLRAIAHHQKFPWPSARKLRGAAQEKR